MADQNPQSAHPIAADDNNGSLTISWCLHEEDTAASVNLEPLRKERLEIPANVINTVCSTDIVAKIKTLLTHSQLRALNVKCVLLSDVGGPLSSNDPLGPIFRGLLARGIEPRIRLELTTNANLRGQHHPFEDCLGIGPMIMKFIETLEDMHELIEKSVVSTDPAKQGIARRLNRGMQAHVNVIRDDLETFRVSGSLAIYKWKPVCQFSPYEPRASIKTRLQSCGDFVQSHTSPFEQMEFACYLKKFL
ncbi:uncharacterized protein KY384_008646 [Bacidia gigantensis]|uniref:uncharacterized protein n=1 Tax=Bacidia gigantensis TaxID=2732470 RepID=UPI001D049082|nr:uncharacterized protein KY384_008646 [Bacidia gigantensis]KAG8527216.1 hypothetical protein KY384_008646 [Bacidia gigantensis]